MISEEGAAVFVEDGLVDACFGVDGGADRADGGGDACVGTAEHGAAEFDGAEAGVGKVLGGGGGGFEPTIVGQVNDDLGRAANKFPGQAWDGVFKADGGDDLDGFAAEVDLKWVEGFSCAE